MNYANFNKEINTIVNNGYEKEIIFNLINKKRKRLLLKQFYNIDDINTNTIFVTNKCDILRALAV